MYFFLTKKMCFCGILTPVFKFFKKELVFFFKFRWALHLQRPKNMLGSAYAAPTGLLMFLINVYQCAYLLMFLTNVYQYAYLLMVLTNVYQCEYLLMFLINVYQCAFWLMFLTNVYQCMYLLMFLTNVYQC